MQSGHRAAHRRIWRALALLLPLALAGALGLRLATLPETPPVLLEPPR